jgi:hypothetical protein
VAQSNRHRVERNARRAPQANNLDQAGFLERARSDGTDFGPLYAKISNMPDIPIAAIKPGDKVFARGTQEYARSGGRMRQGAA